MHHIGRVKNAWWIQGSGTIQQCRCLNGSTTSTLCSYKFAKSCHIQNDHVPNQRGCPHSSFLEERRLALPSASGAPGEAMGLPMFLGASQLDNTRQASVAGAQGMRGQLTSIFEEDDMGGTTEEQLKGCPAVWWSASQKCKSWCHG